MVTSIEIWDEGFNLFEVSQDTDTVSTHTGTTVDIATAPWTIDQWIGYSIKFTSGALNDNGYVVTGNDTDTITCSAADFSTLVNGEAFKIISTGKVLDNTGAPVAEISVSTETVQTLTQSYGYGFDDLFTLDNAGSPVAEVSLSTESVQTLTQSYGYGFDDLFIFSGDPPITGEYVISGNVSNSLGQDLEDVTIAFTDGVSYETTTDSSGNYTQDVSPDIYDVITSIPGNPDQSASVDATLADQTQDFIFPITTAPQDKGITLIERLLLKIR